MMVGNVRFLLLLAASLAFCLAQDTDDNQDSEEPSENEEVDAYWVNKRVFTRPDPLSDIEGVWAKYKSALKSSNKQLEDLILDLDNTLERAKILGVPAAASAANALCAKNFAKCSLQLATCSAMTKGEKPANTKTEKASAALQSKLLKGCKSINIGGEPSYIFCPSANVTWLLARRSCDLAGLELISIESKLENKHVFTHMGAVRHGMWTSGTDLGSEGRFYWASNLRPFTFVNWLKGQPDRYGYIQHCISVGNDKDRPGQLFWADDNCLNSRAFACEIK